ncbi:uncharacterized protein LOC127751569 [Frankliniella occidentalis]|uniref:Uncharacterized protein LOC127751569 n=1 Tax=Frankliniella occidentalis TaxID=133901 RepID=A0A9C6X8V1_FRAOC|nr:uncharacterized protein LOC127751569 [Frankliniella occidentalis]
MFKRLDLTNFLSQHEIKTGVYHFSSYRAKACAYPTPQHWLFHHHKLCKCYVFKFFVFFFCFCLIEHLTFDLQKHRSSFIVKCNLRCFFSLQSKSLFQHDYSTKSNLSHRVPLKPLNINNSNTTPSKISANISYSNSCPNKIYVPYSIQSSAPPQVVSINPRHLPFKLLNSSNNANTTVPLARVNNINCSTISVSNIFYCTWKPLFNLALRLCF